MKKLNIASNFPYSNFSFQEESGNSKGTLIFSGINNYVLEPINKISGTKEDTIPLVSLNFGEKDLVIANNHHSIRMEKNRENSKISFLQTAEQKSINMQFGTLYSVPHGGGVYLDTFNLSYKTGNLNLDVRPKVNGVPVLLSGEGGGVSDKAVLVTGSQRISGTKIFAGSLGLGDAINPDNNKLYFYDTGTQGYNTIKTYSSSVFTENIFFELSDQSTNQFYIDIATKTISGNNNSTINFADNISVSGKGIFNAIDLNNIDNINISGVDVSFSSGTIDLGNSKLINAVPEIINLSTNFTISGNYNGRTILANSSSSITGTILSGNANGFNASIFQIGNGSVKITGAGNGIIINSYNNQYSTAGKYAKVSILHTGNNGYIIAGNTV
jgi:hypothetical protein